MHFGRNLRMDMISSAVNALPATQIGSDIQMTVLKKAIDAQAQSALSLIQALPDPRAGLSAHLGNNINTTA
jgi:hypothetical protein